jgi:hypothetical protein
MAVTGRSSLPAGLAFVAATLDTTSIPAGLIDTYPAKTALFAGANLSA